MVGRHVLLGVSGSIASYKAAILIRLLRKAGAEVKIIMTPEATHFIAPLTLATLSKNEVLVSFEKQEGGLWNNHVDLGLWADVFVIAPATSATLARMARGSADNLLTATYLSARCPVFFAPAMDLDMWAHPSTQANCALLASYGNIPLGPAKGELASGLDGEGRMIEPVEILEEIRRFFHPKLLLNGEVILITAGPTREKIDPVRYLSNESTGKMGYALARQAAQNGAQVILISGPTPLKLEHPNIHLISVNTAREMYEACLEQFPKSTITILSAAVADYTPVETHAHKIKSSEPHLLVSFEKTKDIAAELGIRKSPSQIVVGFALELESALDHAKEKLNQKHLNLIVLNSLSDRGAGFGHETNQVTILDDTGKIIPYSLKLKSEVAHDILQSIVEYRAEHVEKYSKSE